MSGLEDNVSGHRHVWDLIPWVINGRASAEERELVQEHVALCGDCREEFAFQKQVHRAMAAESRPEATAPASLDRLWSRIDRGGGAQKTQLAAPPALLRWLAVAVVVEAIGLAALSAQVWRGSGDAPYHTLSTSSPATARAAIRVVLAPDLALPELQALLGETRLQIVGGPSEAGVYSLAPLDADARPQLQALLQRLRAHPGVRFAEPLQQSADERR